MSFELRPIFRSLLNNYGHAAGYASCMVLAIIPTLVVFVAAYILKKMYFLKPSSYAKTTAMLTGGSVAIMISTARFIFATG